MWLPETYKEAFLDGVNLVVAATSDEKLNLRIGDDARRRGLPCCIASSARASTLLFPVVHRSAPFTIAVDSGGSDCTGSIRLRNQLAALLGEAVMQEPVDHEPATHAPETIHLDAKKDEKAKGLVSLVGAGPGSADLITVRGLRALKRADVILSDGLVPDTVIKELEAGLESRHVVRPPNKWTQEQVNAFLVEAAAGGRRVVHLKGGDAFVFGRGREELAALKRRGIPCEVIPGPSACTAALTAAGILATCREKGRSFAVVSARCAGGGLNTAFPRADSLIIFMGVHALPAVKAQLLSDGWDPETPAAILESATHPWERRVTGSLLDIDERARKEAVASPALILVGFAASNEAMNGCGPIVLFTGLDPTNFRPLGRLLHWPALQLETSARASRRTPDIIARIRRKRYDTLLFTDKMSVAPLFDALHAHALDARALAGLNIVAGSADTEARLREHGIMPDATAVLPGKVGMDRALGHVNGRAVLILQGTHTPRGLVPDLKRRGAQVTRQAWHRLVRHPELGRPLPHHHAIYFVSPSAVRAYWRIYGAQAFARDVWCMGKATLDCVRKLGGTGTIVMPEGSASPVAGASSRASSMGCLHP